MSRIPVIYMEKRCVDFRVKIDRTRGKCDTGVGKWNLTIIAYFADSFEFSKQATLKI